MICSSYGRFVRTKRCSSWPPRFSWQSYLVWNTYVPLIQPPLTYHLGYLTELGDICVDDHQPNIIPAHSNTRPGIEDREVQGHITGQRGEDNTCKYKFITSSVVLTKMVNTRGSLLSGSRKHCTLRMLDKSGWVFLLVPFLLTLVKEMFGRIERVGSHMAHPSESKPQPMLKGIIIDARNILDVDARCVFAVFVHLANVCQRNAHTAYYDWRLP